MKKGCLGCLLFFILPFFLLPFFFSGELSEHGGEATGLAVAFNGNIPKDYLFFQRLKDVVQSQMNMRKQQLVQL